MKTVKNYLLGVIVSAVITAIVMYLSLGLFGIAVLCLIPIVMVATAWDESLFNKSAWEEVSLILWAALVYSVMFSSWTWTSLVIVIVIIAGLKLWKTWPTPSIMAAWLTGMELATVGMEYYANHVYYMDNLLHDAAVVIFAIYAIAWDIHSAKKKL
ncbi:MAG: hypothetical protein Q4D11_00660 [Rhodospirillales bacterium]|nr:hypothetical protein [Rhodospirillales bacterium]